MGTRKHGSAVVWLLLATTGALACTTSSGQTRRGGSGDITRDELALIPVSDVESIRRVSASDATTRFGTGFPAGAIEVRTRRNEEG